MIPELKKAPNSSYKVWIEIKTSQDVGQMMMKSLINSIQHNIAIKAYMKLWIFIVQSKIVQEYIINKQALCNQVEPLKIYLARLNHFL